MPHWLGITLAGLAFLAVFGIVTYHLYKRQKARIEKEREIESRIYTLESMVAQKE